jgi:hypothetical protein
MHVLCIVSVVLEVILSNKLHASCHCSKFRDSFSWSRFVRVSILRECVEKNARLKGSKVFCGIGFNSLEFVREGGGGGHTSIMLLGRNSETGKWSKLCGKSKFVCEVYMTWFGDLMKYPSRRLICV